MSPALSDLPIRKVVRVIESLGFAYVRTKAATPCTGTRMGGPWSSRNMAPSSAAPLHQFCGKLGSSLANSGSCSADSHPNIGPR